MSWELCLRAGFEQTLCRGLSLPVFLKTMFGSMRGSAGVILGTVGGRDPGSCSYSQPVSWDRLHTTALLLSWGPDSGPFNRKTPSELVNHSKSRLALGVFVCKGVLGSCSTCQVCVRSKQTGRTCPRVTWASNFPALCRNVMQISCKPRISQELFSKHSNTPHPTSPAFTRQCWISAKTSIG